MKGRGAVDNPQNRFEEIRYESDPDGDPEFGNPPPVPTRYFRDPWKTVISRNDSPDVGFSASINPYRGCEHGCAYCYARPTHEYLGLSAGVDFETRIFVKEDAPAMLRRELAADSWTPQEVVASGVTDCYQPVERKLAITRGCLEVLLDFRNPVGVITKSHLVARDADVLSDLARFSAAAVFVSVTTLDEALAERLEPRAARPSRRLAAIRALSDAKVPVGVMMGPVIPGLTDREILPVLSAARDAGASWAGWTMVRLPHAVKDVFTGWLGEHAPLKKEKVLGRIRAVRGGKLNDPRFGSRMRGEGFWAREIAGLFRATALRLGYGRERLEMSTAHFRRPGLTQATFFG